MSFDLTNKNISDTYQNLLQKTGSDGKLFDLLGNPIKDLTIQGALIAESYIVSQSSTIHSSGSTAFGNTTDDTHTFIGDINTTGHITASGNISASGDDHILGGSIFVGKHDGQNKYHFDRFSSDFPLSFIQAGSQDLDTGVGLGLLIRDSNGAPTRGLTISSSGFVQVNDIFFSKPIPEALTVEGNISASNGNGKVFLGGGRGNNAALILTDSSNNFSASLIQGTTATSLKLNQNNNQDFSIDTHNSDNNFYIEGAGGNVGIGTNNPGEKLTVVGNISSSGNIYGDTVYVGDSELRLRENPTGVLESSSPFSTTHITASGNISSSGIVYMDSASIGGGIFTSASLAAGGGGTGTITALNNQTANRLVTIGSTTTELDGEANLTYDGTTFTVNDTMQVSSGDLTVGGDISSSGDLYLEDGKNIEFTGIGSGNLNGTDLTLSASTSNIALNTGNDIVFQTGSQIAMVIDGGTGGNVGIGTSLDPPKKLTVGGDISASGQLNVGNYDSTDGHITASGNISASGFITVGGEVQSQGQRVGVYDGATTRLGDSASPTGLYGTKITTGVGFSGTHITASGNISASGKVITQEIESDDNIILDAAGDTLIEGSDFYLQSSRFLYFDGLGSNDFGWRVYEGTDGKKRFVNRVSDFGGAMVMSHSFVGIGGTGVNNDPPKTLTVAGDISGSDDLFIGGDINVGNVDPDGNGIGGPHQIKISSTTGGPSGSIKFNSSNVSQTIRQAKDLNNGALIFTDNDGVDTIFINTVHADAKELVVEGGISASKDFFVGDSDGAYFSSSLGNVELSGSGKGQIEVDYRLFDTASINPAIGTGIGDIVKFGGTTTNAGQVYYLQNNGTWAPTDADAGGTTSGSIAVALGTNSTNDGMLLNGIVTLDHDPGANAGLGAPVYLSTTEGRTSVDAPGSGDFARIIGYKISGSFGIYFKPDNTTIEVA